MDQCRLPWVVLGAALLAAATLTAPAAPPGGPELAPPVSFTAAEDHSNMMGQLGIQAVRPGASGDENDPDHANYDELLANPYPTLPDPLRLDDGSQVTSADTWWRRRRPEIVSALENDVYGHIPKDVPKVTWHVARRGRGSLGGYPIVYTRLNGHVDNSAYPAINVDIPVTLVLPAAAKGRVPVLIMFWFGPTPVPPTEPSDAELGRINGALRSALSRADPALNAVFRDHPGTALIARSPFSSLRRNADGDPPSIVELIAAGWGFAVLDPTLVQADNGAGLTRGIIGLANKGQPRTPGQWGALRAWGWAASRTLDYLDSAPAVDSRHVGIEGVSRYGKAALVTLAFDQRFAMGLIGSSGRGGAALLRRNFGETLANLTGSGEYHWMAGNFLKYAAAKAVFGPRNPGDLPVDDPAWATDRAAEGWLTFDVDSHDLPPEQKAGVPIVYAALGDHSRDTSYFLDMYLRDTRALQYIRSSRRWDGRTVVLTGTSMGGQQSLVTAGLNPGKVTAVLVNEPSGAESNGDLHGRRAGYPNWDSGDPQVMRTALYFDTVNFAPHITAPTLIAMGFIDTTAPPVGIWTELDEIPGPKEAVPMIESEHNNITPDKQDAWLHRSEEVLATIVHGGRFIPNEALTRPVPTVASSAGAP